MILLTWIRSREPPDEDTLEDIGDAKYVWYTKVRQTTDLDVADNSFTRPVQKCPDEKIMQIYVRLHLEKIHEASGNRSFVRCIIAVRITRRARHRIERLSRRRRPHPPENGILI